MVLNKISHDTLLKSFRIFKTLMHLQYYCNIRFVVEIVITVQQRFKPGVAKHGDSVSLLLIIGPL